MCSMDKRDGIVGICTSTGDMISVIRMRQEEPGRTSFIYAQDFPKSPKETLLDHSVPIFYYNGTWNGVQGVTMRGRKGVDWLWMYLSGLMHAE